ncbi:hypothetical protein CDV31_011739 [Fusarium ambrosium]|uniref:Transcription factor domain-containing protein n=1 Tax=Fusarium ambrosium TaxID=131363 RepID=A0A428TEW7_9HYPO|nr:hypothetical protein CDV31_011739 [Fusarium ambrosium]
MVEEGAHILDIFSQFITNGIFKALFDNWSYHDLDSRLGAFLVPRFLETMTSDLLGHLGPSADRHSELLRMSQRLIAASRVPLEFHDAMTLREIAMCDVRAPHPACATEDERQSLKKCLFYSSTLCAQFCESLETLNDVLVIFLYENFLLYSLHLGDQSFQTWRRLNDAINAMFAHGLHQKLDGDLHTPLFLIELRKHIFGRVYASDISFAVFLGRPPRVSQRYCIIHRPLDLKADAYEMTGEALEEELAHLDQHEWNTSSEVRLHVVLRWSVTMCKIREEMLEAILGSQVTDRQQLIRTLRIKVENAWNELPEYLTITASDIWARNRPGTVVDRLYLIRLFYLQAVFFIELTASIHGNVDNDTLYIISSDLLSWVNEAMLRRERLSKLGLSSLAWRAVTCGLPAAATLAKYMIPGSPQPSRKWRDANAFAKVIQDLSVFIRHMNYLHEPGDANYEIFRQAKAVLQRVIATRLDPHTLLEERELQTCPTPIFPPDMLSIDQWVLRPEFWMEFEHPVVFDTISHPDTQNID